MYDYSTGYSTATTSDTAGILGVLAGIGIALWLVIIAVAVLTLIGQWKVFKKAGKNGYECLIPGHSTYALLEIGGLNTALFFIILIPFGAIVLEFMTNIEMAKKFGKSAGFGVLMTFFPFVCYPILGLGSAKYSG